MVTVCLTQNMKSFIFGLSIPLVTMIIVHSAKRLFTISFALLIGYMHKDEF